MKKGWLLGLMALGLTLAVVGCARGRETPTPTPMLPSPYQKGAELYQRLGCPVCHRVEGSSTGTVGPDLNAVADTAASRQPGVSAEEYIRESILQPDAFITPMFEPGLMPGYRPALSDEHLQSLVTFLLSQGRGRRLFVSACAACHGIRGLAGPGREGAGPDLTNIATVASQRQPGVSAEEHIRESILQPDAFITPMFDPGRMPVSALSGEDIEALVKFLLAQK